MLKLPDYILQQIDQRKLTNEQRVRIALDYQQNPYKWWVPTGAQEEFINGLSQIGQYSKTRIKGQRVRCRHGGFFGGNCTGKTVTLVMTALGVSYEKVLNPWCAKSTFFTDKSWANCAGPGGSLVILLIMKKTVVNMVLSPEVKKWAAKDSYTVERGDGYDQVFRFPKATWYVFTPEQDVGQIAGPTVDLIMSDETFSMNLYSELMQRLRGKGAFLTFVTPLWSRDANDLVDKMMGMPEDQRVVITAHKESACKKHGIRGWREHEVVAEDIRVCDSERYPAIVEGKPMAYSGKLFKQFDYDANVVAGGDDECIELVRINKATLYASCDPAEARPYAIGWKAIFPNGDGLWIDEWPECDPGLDHEPEIGDNLLRYYLSPRLCYFEDIGGMRLRPSEAAEIVKAKEALIESRYGLKVFRRFIDPFYAARAIGGRVSLMAQLAQFGVWFDPALVEQDYAAAHSRIRELLGHKKDDSGKIIVPARMRFNSRCRNLIHSVSKIAYPGEQKRGAFTGRLGDRVDEKDKLKDFLDVIRYMVQRQPYYRQDVKKDRPPDIEYDYFNRRKSDHNFGVYQGLS